MRIGYDLYGLHNNYSGGVNTFSLGLLEGLIAGLTEGSNIVIIANNENKIKFSKIIEKNQNVNIFVIKNSITSKIINRIIEYLAWILNNYKIRAWYELLFRKSVNKKISKLVDLLIVPTSVLNFYQLSVPTILCIHDIQQEYHPENFSLNQKIVRWSTYRLSCLRSTYIQVSSKYIEECINDKYKMIDHRKIFYAPEGVDLSKFDPNAEMLRPKLPIDIENLGFLFYPAQIWKHKNHVLLVNSLAEFRDETGREMPCVLCGQDFQYWHEINKLIKSFNLKSIYYLGKISQKEMIWLYTNCDAVLALGLHESSSLPLKEGAVFGKPLICADIEPNIEISKQLKVCIIHKNSKNSLIDNLRKLQFTPEILTKDAILNKNFLYKFDWKNISRIYIDLISVTRR
jgi:glycosyltransferase involved in cell wall biosynthesis